MSGPEDEWDELNQTPDADTYEDDGEPWDHESTYEEDPEIEEEDEE